MMTETVSSTNRPPTIASTISCLVRRRRRPARRRSTSEPVSPMNTMAGGALNHRKPRPAPTSARAEHRELARAGHVVELQVVGEDRVADEIGDQREHAGRDDHRHDGEAVEPVGQVHRVGGADHHQDRRTAGRRQPSGISTSLRNGTASAVAQRRRGEAHDDPDGRDAGRSATWPQQLDACRARPWGCAWSPSGSRRRSRCAPKPSVTTSTTQT